MTNAELGAALLAIVGLLSAAHVGGYISNVFAYLAWAERLSAVCWLGCTGLARLAPDLHAAISPPFPARPG